MSGCPGCGLFLHHAAGCEGVVAVFYRFYQRYEEPGFQSIEEAEAFLGAGEDAGTLASHSVRIGDEVVRSREALGYDWPTLTPTHTEPSQGVAE